MNTALLLQMLPVPSLWHAGFLLDQLSPPAPPVPPAAAGTDAEAAEAAAEWGRWVL